MIMQTATSNPLTNFINHNSDIMFVFAYILPVIFILLLLVSIGLTLGKIERLLRDAAKERNAIIPTNDKERESSVLQDNS